MNLKIDLGCGARPLEGFVGVDLDPQFKPDIVADITRPIPGLPDGCAEHVRCRHVMEHLYGTSYYEAMMEMARLLKPGGTFEIRVPHPSSDCAMVLGHVHVLTPLWWREMQRDGWLQGKLIIDSITEEFDAQFLKDREGLGHPPEVLLRYLRNVYFETLVTGHKP